MKTLKKGDPCRVRLHTGEVVEAVYDEPMHLDKHHHAWNGNILLAVGEYGNCRFVGPACVPVPMEGSMSANEYGLDASYMKGKLKIFLRDIDRHTPDEAARVLARLSMVADEKVLREPEFNERDTYRELCVELLEILKDSHLIREGEYRKAAKDAITKAEKVLGGKNGTSN